jgi:hypothetical protein
MIYLVVCGLYNSHSLFFPFLAHGLFGFISVSLLKFFDHTLESDLDLGGDVGVGNQVLIEDFVVTTLWVGVLHLVHVGQQLLEQVDVPDCYR